MDTPHPTEDQGAQTRAPGLAAGEPPAPAVEDLDRHYTRCACLEDEAS